MPKIKWVADEEGKFYPPTIPQAVVDPTSGKSARAELDEKANHGYESVPKTLKEVDDEKVDKSSVVGETGQGETTVMHQKSVTYELSSKASHGYESNPKTLKSVDDEKADHGYDAEETQKTLKEVDTLATQNAEDISQLAGEVSLKENKVEGKGLINIKSAEALSDVYLLDDQEDRLEIITDSSGKVVEYRDLTGKKFLSHPTNQDDILYEKIEDVRKAMGAEVIADVVQGKSGTIPVVIHEGDRLEFIVENISQNDVVQITVGVGNGTTIHTYAFSAEHFTENRQKTIIAQQDFGIIKYYVYGGLADVKCLLYPTLIDTTGLINGITNVTKTETVADGGINQIVFETTSGDTVALNVRNGKQGSQGIQGPQGLQGNSGYTGAVGELEVVNNLTDGGATKALSAEMGKTLEAKTSVLKNMRVVNVQNHGIIPGGTNIGAMAQALIDSMPPEGMILYFPKGTYDFEVGMNVSGKNNLTIMGDGIGHTIFHSLGVGSARNTIIFNDSLPSGGNVNDYTITNLHLHDFTIDSGAKGVFVSLMIDCVARNLEIKNTNFTGFGCDHFISGLIENVRCYNCGVLGDLSTTAHGCSGIGIGVGWFNRGNEALTISNCHTNGNKQFGIFVEKQVARPHDIPVGVNIIGCTAEGNRTGFGIAGYDSANVIGCIAYKNYHAGFSYDTGTYYDANLTEAYSRRAKFIGCTAMKNGIDIPIDYPLYHGEENGYGFYVLGDHDGIELISCNSIGNLKSGIVFTNGCKYVNINGGEYSENGLHGIEINGIFEFFKISPTTVMNNTLHGIYVNGAISNGFLNNTIIKSNDCGIFRTAVTVATNVIEDNIIFDGNITNKNY